jgi:hypothetical protein
MSGADRRALLVVPVPLGFFLAVATFLFFHHGVVGGLV